MVDFYQLFLGRLLRNDLASSIIISLALILYLCLKAQRKYAQSLSIKQCSFVIDECHHEFDEYH